MKKRLGLVAVLAALMALTFVSCGVKESDLVGTWKVVSGLSTSEVGAPAGAALYIEFKSTGEFELSYKAAGQTVPGATGEWSLKGKTLTVKMFGDEDSGEVTLNGKTLEWKGEDMTLKLEKQ